MIVVLFLYFIIPIGFCMTFNNTFPVLILLIFEFPFTSYKKDKMANVVNIFSLICS